MVSAGTAALSPRGLPSSCVFLPPSLSGSLNQLSSYKDTSPTESEATLMTSFKRSDSFRGPVSKYGHIRVLRLGGIWGEMQSAHRGIQASLLPWREQPSTCNSVSFQDVALAKLLNIMLIACPLSALVWLQLDFVQGIHTFISLWSHL